MKKILITLLVLFILLAALILLRQNEAAPGLKIISTAKEQIITFEEIESLAKYDFNTLRGQTYQGWLLTDILTLAGITNYSDLILRSVDGAKINLTKELISESVLIRTEENDTSYFRLIIPSDEFGQRWMKYLVSLEVRS